MKNLNDELKNILEDYSDEIIKISNEAIDETAKEAIEELKSSGDFKDKRGKYRKGWKVKSGSSFLGVKGAIIHNKEYQLTHLLEYGHLTRNGKRTRAFPHISKVEEKLGEKLERKIKEKL